MTATVSKNMPAVVDTKPGVPLSKNPVVKFMPKELVIRFDDILYMEAAHNQDGMESSNSSKTITTGSLNTGSLLTRITNITPNEPEPR